MPPKRQTGYGLSPRMRGNPTLPDLYGIRQRSIPAYAGEPRWIWIRSGTGQVYPRVCGGTA